ncbi:MAG: hypothetical protein U9O98_01375 [Asgard group archaeon]|nr:hypothetical protein [Asgard group archaeon]
MINSNQISELLDILYERNTNFGLSSIQKDLAFTALLDHDKLKLMHHLALIIEKEYADENYKTDNFSYLDYFETTEEKKRMYEYLFDAILDLQEEYFFGTELRSFSDSFYLHNKAERPMNELAEKLGFDYVSDFILYNILQRLKEILPQASPKKPITINKLTQLCQGSEDKIITTIKKLLELYPEMGDYNDLDMVFIPSENIKAFEEIVYIHMIINPWS